MLTTMGYKPPGTVVVNMESRAYTVNICACTSGSKQSEDGTGQNKHMYRRIFINMFEELRRVSFALALALVY